MIGGFFYLYLCHIKIEIEMITLKTKLEHRWGTNRVLPVVGEVFISEEGTIQVKSLEIAEQLQDSGCDFFIVKGGKEETGKVVDKDLVKTKETTVESDEIKPQTDEDGELEKGKEGDEIKPQTEPNGELGTAATSEGQKSKEDSKLPEPSNTPLEEDPAVELAKLKVLDLQTLAAPFPKEEWVTLKKDDLINYLVVKLEEAKNKD